MPEKKRSAATGFSYPKNENLSDAVNSSQVLMHDFVLRENLAQFVRERIPERVIYAKGIGAYGTFTVTGDISEFTRARLFSQRGNSCRIFARFSSLGSEKGSADTDRNPRGFALKFYSEDGNWDLVGNNTPVFFVKDARKFPEFLQTQKRDPKTNLKSATLMWDFFSHNPESLHEVLILLSNRGTPYGYRHMHGYGSHTFSMINHSNERVWVKFHIKSQQGIKNFSHDEAVKMRGENPDFAQQDFVNAIEQGDYPRWKVFIQVMTEEQAAEARWNPFDVTKVWLHDDFPLIEAGEIELNEIPANYFEYVEQAAFSPTNLIDGIGFSPDSMLQSRLFSYADAQRYRLGVHAQLLPVNRCPFEVNKNQHESVMKDSPLKPEHNSAFDGVKSNSAYHSLEFGNVDHQTPSFSRNENDDDHYTQPGLLYTKAMSEDDRKNLVYNIVQSMNAISGPKRDEIINRQLCYFFRADLDLGMRVATGLNVNIDSAMFIHIKE